MMGRRARGHSDVAFVLYSPEAWSVFIMSLLNTQEAEGVLVKGARQGVLRGAIYRAQTKSGVT